MNNRSLVYERHRQEMLRLDRFFLILLGVHFIAAPTIMPLWFDSHMLGLVGGALIFATGAANYVLFKGRSECRIINGVLFMIFSALFIQQNEGMIETHFHVFATMAILLIYRDWRVIIAAVTTTAVYHLGFYFAQSNGVTLFGTPLLIFAGECSLRIVIVHAAWALFEAIILAVYAHKQYHKFLIEANFTEQVKHLIKHPNQIAKPLTLVTDTEDEKDFMNPVNHFFAQVAKALGDTDNGSRQLAMCSGSLLETSNSMNRMAQELDKKAEGAADEVRRMASAVMETAAASEETRGNFSSVVETARNMSDISQGVAQNARQVAGNIDMVVHAIGELESSIGEVAGNCAHAAQVSEDGNRLAKQAAVQVSSLNNGARKIGDVVSIIKNIASHTNLLALNSTIEAASAGEAGKGFAVVANEIKMLAKQTADATDEIAQQVENIQKDSMISHDHMAQVAKIIENLNDLTNSIASAVEQQSASTSEIAHNINTSAESTGELNSLISNIDGGVLDLRQRVEHMSGSIGEIAKAMDEISQTADNFGHATEEVGKIAHQTAISSQSVKEEAGGMTHLSDALSQGVALFQSDQDQNDEDGDNAASGTKKPEIALEPA